MTYMDRLLSAGAVAQDTDGGGEPSREALVLVVEDEPALTSTLRAICDCLNVAVERMPSGDDLAAMLRQRRPMAVIAEMDAVGQDGCNVLMTVAAHDRALPVLLLTGDDPVLLGAIDAVEEMWQLSSVTKWPRLQSVGPVLDFIFRAGRKGSCMRLMSI
jgi:CheY-like chemotaxis protein